MEDKKGKRGGARPGAGRPKGDSRMISFRAPGPLAEQLEEMDNRAEFIRQTLSEAVKARIPGQVGSGQGSSIPMSPGQVGSGQGFPGQVIPGQVIPARSVSPLSLPYFDIKVAAGFPVPLDNDERSQDIDILSMLCPHPEASYLIRVSGDSMIDAGVLSGDIVIVDKSKRNPSPHEIAMCELNGEYTLKHFVSEDGQGWLVPANPAYPKIRISAEDEFSVWGTVTYIIHKARD
ncbi:MAG: S24 family peptidase [Bacteroidales bacterium]|nr:S24 family peptidase [Bacteroidales bacterium]